MNAINFNEATKKMTVPPGFTKDEVFDLPVNEGFYFIRGFHPVACLTSCWEMSEEEREEFLKTGKIYISIMGFGMPAISVEVKNPCGAVEYKHIGKYFHEHGVLPKEYLDELKDPGKQDSFSPPHI